jgi:CheY-like chemotaxis protein
MLVVIVDKKRPAKGQGMSVNILIVDDDDSIRDLLRMVLSVEDNVGEVREAVDGTDAIKVVETFEPDVIVLDYSMPDMDGGEAAREIRHSHPDAKIIAYSGILQRKPEWADDHYVKGDLPDLDAILQSA